MGLNEKEKLFAKEYVINKGNAYQCRKQDTKC